MRVFLLTQTDKLTTLRGVPNVFATRQLAHDRCTENGYSQKADGSYESEHSTRDIIPFTVVDTDASLDLEPETPQYPESDMRLWDKYAAQVSIPDYLDLHLRRELPDAMYSRIREVVRIPDSEPVLDGYVAQFEAMLRSMKADAMAAARFERTAHDE